MSIIRKAAMNFANALPPTWKRSLKWKLMVPDMGASYELLRHKGFSPKHALDIGAYVGKWSTLCKEVWPQVNICMFEPQQDKQALLNAFVQRHPGSLLKQTVLGDKLDEEVQFYLQESGSSTYDMLSHPDLKPIKLKSTTLANAVQGTPFASPDLIKVDVQGAELKVLLGGEAQLRNAEVVCLEVCLAEEYKNAPLFAEVIAFMADHNLLVHDICTIWRNTNTGSMNEADVIFVRKGSQLTDPRYYTRG
jgi:FkbM family methyltransferase